MEKKERERGGKEKEDFFVFLSFQWGLFFSINYFDRIYEHCWHIECIEEMTSPGCVILAHTRAHPTNSIQSLARVGNTQIFEPPKKIGKQTTRERERERDREKSCVYSECASPHGRKDEQKKKKKENEKEKKEEKTRQ